MASLFAQLPDLGRAINEVVMPTYKLYAPLLLANETAIKSTKTTSHRYGPHERQELDIYYPSKPHVRNGRRPVLVFLYGGGMIQGAKQIPGFANGLVHANVGHFFAEKFGFTTVVVDYRLISHGAKFPSGGEDLSLALEWMLENSPGVGVEPMDLFLMGNSAGGMQTTQLLFCNEFAETRRKISIGSGARLRGIILVGVPFHFDKADESRVDVVLKPFYGDDWRSLCPLGQVKSLQQADKLPDFLAGTGVRILLLESELDPVDEILLPRDDFITQWLHFKDHDVKLALCADRIAKHNHISPVLALGTGVHEAEQWGFQVASFVHAGIAFAPGE